MEVTKALVMPQIQISFRAIVQDENLTVLVRAERARIDIEIRIEFLDGDVKPPGFEQPSDRSRSHALTHRGDYTASEENQLCCHLTS